MKYVEGKPAWYSRSERKVSAAKSKANDRRWEAVPIWADGSYPTMLRVLGIIGVDRVGDMISYVARACLAAEHFCTLTSRTVSYREIAEALGWDEWGKRESPNWEWHTAYSALYGVLEAYRQHGWAARCLNCWRSNMGLKREPEAEEVAV